MTRHPFHSNQNDSLESATHSRQSAMLELPKNSEFTGSMAQENERIRASQSAAGILKGAGPDFSISSGSDPFIHPRRSSEGTLATGDIAAKYESRNNPAMVNRDPNRSAGHDYGAWQFNSRAHVPQDYVKWAKENDPKVYEALKDHTKSIHRGARGDFGQAWREHASKDPDSFNESQRKFALEHYLKPLQDKFPRLAQSQALQEQAFATAIQSGVGGASRLLHRAGFDREDKSSQELIADLTTLRTKSYRGNARRYASEGKDLDELSQQNHSKRIDKNAFGDFV